MSIGSRIIVNENTLSAFAPTLAGSYSAPFFVVVSGLELTGNLTVQCTAGFEISLSSGSGYVTSLLLLASSAQVPQTIIYVRFAPTLSQAYTGTVTVTGGGASPKTVALSGTSLVPTLTKDKTAIAFGNIPINSNSAAETIAITSVNLTGIYVGLVASDGFQVFVEGYGWVSSIVIPIANGAIALTSLPVRFCPTENKSYSGTLKISGGGVAEQSVTLTGGILTPTLTTSESSFDFGDIVVDATSVVEAFYLSASNLSPAAGNIVVTCPEGFEICLTSVGTYSRELTIAYTGSALASTSISIRFKPTAVKDYSGKIAVYQDYASIKNVDLIGKGIKDYHVIIIGVMIETSDGYFYRFSETGINSANDGYLYFENGVYSYPDLRVKNFLIYSKLSTESTYRMQEFGARHSSKSNISYAVLHGPLNTDYLDPATFPNVATQAQIDAMILSNFGDANIVLVSETFQPRNLLGSNAVPVGNSADDEVKVFGTNAQPVSSGQFGSYPYFAFTNRGIHAMKPGQTVKFESVAPFALNESIIGKNAILSVGGALFYLTKRGLKVFAAGETKNLSEALFAEDSAFTSMLNDNACIGYYLNEKTGREEIWIGGDAGTYVYSLTHARWFSKPNVRKSYFTIYERMIGWDGETLQEEEAGEIAVGSVITAPIHFGAPDVPKRFRRTYYNKGDIVMSNATEPAVEALQAITSRSIQIVDPNVLEMNDINIELEARYPWRTGENAS